MIDNRILISGNIYASWQIIYFFECVFINETQAKNRQFGDNSMLKRPCIDENHFPYYMLYIDR
jgi:hypothetical protein